MRTCRSQESFTVASTPLLAALGCAASVPGSEALGRRPVLLAAAVLYVLGAALAAAAPSFALLALARCVLGLAVGASSSTIPLYLVRRS